MNSVTVAGDNAADDSFVVDMDNGDPIPAAGLTFNGQGQASSDVLTIEDNVTNATVTHTFTNDSDGSISVTDGTINYTGLEPITDSVPTTARVFTFNANNEAIVLDDDGGAGNSIGTIDSDFAEIVTFDVSVTTSITINAAGGDDTITIREVDSAYTGSVAVNGDDDDDSIVIDFDSGDPIPAGGLTVDGSAGGTNSDDLELTGTGSIATVTHLGTSTSAGSVVVSGLGTVTYAGLEAGIDDNLDDATARVFDMTAAAETATLEDNGSGGDSIGTFTASTSPDVNFDISGTTSVTVNAGADNDVLDVEQIDSAYTGSVAINGDDDDDELELHFGSGDPIPAGGFTYDGGSAGSDSDNLILDDGGTHTTVTYSDTGVDAGTIATDDGTVTYTEVELGITDDLPVTARVFTYTLGAETIEVDDNGAVGDDDDVITSTASQTVVYNSDVTTSLTINAGTGDDTIIVNDLDNSFTGSVAVNGDAGDDTLDVDWEANALSPLARVSGFAYDGGGETGTPGDALRLIDGTVTTVVHTYTNLNDGSVTVDGDVMTYVDLEPIDDELVATTRTFTFSGSDDDIELDSNFSGTTSEISTTSGTSETTEFDHTGTTTVIINGGAGDDDFNVEPSDDYAITANGETETADDSFRLNSSSLDGGIKITLTETDNENGVYSFSASFEDVTYTDMEIVTMRLHDPAAFSGSTYEQDALYPLVGESGISIEPYFNWDIDIMNTGPAPSIPTALEIEVATSTAFTPGVIVFESLRVNPESCVRVKKV